jgi:outer membrane autotransporter protein
MSNYRNVPVRGALFLSLLCSVAPLRALAADNTIGAGASETDAQTVTGTDSLTIEKGGRLDVDGKAITWTGPSAAPGVTITNSGTITATGRGLDTTNNSNPRNITIINNEGASIVTGDDALRINTDVTEGSVTVENRGLISAEGGQAIDFDKINSTAGSVTINNYATGELSAADADAVRPGEGGVVNNWGKIISSAPTNTSGDEDDDTSNDGVDLQGHSGTVHNYAGGLISGARHGITSDVNVDVTNEKGATIIGRNGSGIGSDGNGTVLNYGTITGAIDDNSVNGDGDGVDVDGLADITNYGTIQGIGAKGQKDGSPNGSEGIAAGGGTIRNLGVDSVISGKDNAILIDDSAAGNAPFATEIVNEGTIRGTSGFAIRLIGNQNDTITNSGTIDAGNGLAIDMGGGDDTLNLYATSKIVGTIDGGAGSDTITLTGSGTFGGADNFEFLEIVSGDWILTGDQAYSGGISIDDGSISIDGTLAADMTIGAGSILDGNGTFGSLTVDGTIAPGHSIGIITVTGNYTQGAGSDYFVEFDGTTSDFIDVTGTATLGGTVTAAPYGAGGTAAGRRYTILTATGGIVGGTTYTLTDPNVTAFLTGALAYDTNNVYLDITRNAVTFSSMAATENQRRVAAAVDGLGAGNTVYDGVSSVADASAAAAAFDSLSGEFHASMKTAMIEDSRFIRDAISARLNHAVNGVTVTGAIAASKATGFGVWGQTFGSWGTSGGDGYADLDRSTGGLVAGLDGEFADSWRAGFLAGYSHGSYDANGLSANSDSDDYHVGVYSAGTIGAFGLSAGAAYSWHDISTERSVSLPGLTEKLKADYDAHTLQVFGELNYDLKAGDANLQPFANLAYVHLGETGFAETGGASALTSAGGDTDTTFATFGLRASTDIAFGETAASLRGAVAWRHAFGDINPTSNVSLSGAGFTVSGAPVAEDAALIDAGIDFKLAANTTLGLTYSGQLAEDATAHSIKANFAVKF